MTGKKAQLDVIISMDSTQTMGVVKVKEGTVKKSEGVLLDIVLLKTFITKIEGFTDSWKETDFKVDVLADYEGNKFLSLRSKRMEKESMEYILCGKNKKEDE